MADPNAEMQALPLRGCNHVVFMPSHAYMQVTGIEHEIMWISTGFLSLSNFFRSAEKNMVLILQTVVQ